MATEASLKYVQQMFVAYLGRAATESAQTYYADLIDANEELSKAQMFDDLYNSAEGQALYGSMTVDQVIEQIFLNCFERDPLFAGLTYYYNAIGDGTFNILEAAAVIADDASNPADVAVFDAKKTAADKITAELGTDAVKIAGYTSNAADARTSLNKVTDAGTAASYDAAAEVSAISSGNQVGATTALTTSTDALLGTVNNDTYTGTDLTYGSADSITDITSTDQDRLVITAAADITATPTITGVESATFTATELLSSGDTTFAVATDNIAGTVEMTFSASNADTLLDTLNVTGLKDTKTVNTGTFATVNLGAATDADLVVKPGAAMTLDVNGAADDLTVTSSYDVTIASGTVDATEDLTISGEDVTVNVAAILGNVDIDATKTATVTTAGAKGTVDVDAVGDVVVTAAAALGNVNISGEDVTATLTAAKGTIVVTATEDIVDADGAGASASVTLSAAAGAIGTSGDHAIFSAATGLSATAGKDSFIGADAATAITLTSTGAAGAEVDFTLAAAAVDTLTLAGSSPINVLVDAADLSTETVTNNNTGGATVSLNAAATADLSLVSADAIRLMADFGNAGNTLTLANTGAVVELDDAQAQGTGAFVLKAKTSTSAATNSITINTSNSDGTAGDATAQLVGMTLTDYGSATIDTTGSKFDSTGSITADDLTSLVVKGTKDFDLNTNTVTGKSSGVTVDATQLAGVLTMVVDGTANGVSVVKGGSGADVITASAAAASGAAHDIDGNAGADTVIISGATAKVDFSGGNQNDTLDVNADATGTLIFSGGSGTDTLDIAGNDVSGAAITLTSVEKIVFDTGADIDASVVSGGTFIVDTTAGGTDVFTIVADQVTVDLSNFAFTSNWEDNFDNFVIDMSALGLATTVTGSSKIDNITGGSAADNLSGGDGADAIVGGAGNDTINGGAGNDTLTGGTGNDAYTLGAGTDTVVFTASSNGSDTVADFTTSDVLNVSAYLTGGALLNTTGAGGTITLATVAALAASGTPIAVADNKGYIAEVAAEATIDSVADIVTALADGGVMDAVDVTASATAVLIVGGADDDTTFYVYVIANDGTAAVTAGEVQLIGTITSNITNGVDGLLTSNFTF